MPGKTTVRATKQKGPGHFICAADCRWHIHHHVGKWCVSSVGDYRPRHANGVQDEVGYRRFYETMVFDLSRGEGRGRWSEVAFAGYMTEDEATEGHSILLAEFRERAKRSETRRMRKAAKP